MESPWSHLGARGTPLSACVDHWEMILGSRRRTIDRIFANLIFSCLRVGKTEISIMVNVDNIL